MNATIGWVVAVVVALGAGYYIFYMIPPQQTGEMATSTPQTGSEQAADPQMNGTWKSNTDAKFTREMRADGVVIDRYEGDATAGVNGSWSVVDPMQEQMLSSMAASLAGMTVIKVVWEGGVETTYFSVNKVDGTSMTITDLSGSGGVTVFTKI